MRKWLRYIGGMVAVVSLLGLPPNVHGESCSLELKKTDPTTSSRESYIFRATSSQHFSKAITGGIRFGGKNDVPEFDEVIKTDRAEYRATHPVRGVIKLGSQDFGFVLDSSVNKEEELDEEEQADQKEESGGLLSSLSRILLGEKAKPKKTDDFQLVPYDRLYFDCDHDGDLTDEEVVDASTTSNYADRTYVATSFPRVDVPILVDSTKLDYAFTLRVTAQSSSSYAYVSGSVSAAAYREGEITVAGNKHRVVLVDFNSNGRFDDEPAINPSVRTSDGKVYATQGDRLYIDPDLNAVSRSPYDISTADDQFDVCKLLHLDGRFYELTVSPAGDKLSLEPSEVEVGYVSNPNPATVVVYGDQGLVKIRYDESGKAPLPVGAWKLRSYTIDRSGMDEPKKAAEAEPSILGVLSEALGPTAAARAPRSTVVSATATSRYETVDVEKGETVPLPFGPPYRPTVDVQYQQGTGQVSLGLTLLGTADEVCTDMKIKGSRPGKPRFTITDVAEDQVAEGEFEYG